jgi:hypothetical protein
LIGLGNTGVPVPASAVQILKFSKAQCDFITVPPGDTLEHGVDIGHTREENLKARKRENSGGFVVKNIL